MSLTDILYEAIDSVPGSQFAGVIGTDGLRVEMAYADDETDYDLDLAELELSTLAAAASAASGRIGAGLVRALTLETEDLTFLAALITPGYFAVIGTVAEGDPYETRLALEQLVDRVRAEL